MAGTICGTPVQVCMLRVAKLEPNGVPKPGPGNLYVTDSIIRLSAEPEIAEGEDFEQKNGCGAVCVSFKDCDRIKRINLELQVCTHDPELTEMLVGGLLLKSGANTRGYAFPSVGDEPCSNGVSIEAWSKNIVGDAQHPTFPYVRFVYPRTYWQMGPRVQENGIMELTFRGFGVENPNWFNGPGNDWPYDSSRVAMYAFDTSVPTPTCGAITLAAS